MTEVNINDVKTLPEDTKVTVTAKVREELQSVDQPLQYNRTMTRTSFIIADRTTAIELTLWGNEDKLVEGHSYKLNNLSIKTFESTKLSTNPYSTITCIPDIGQVTDDDVEDINTSTIRGTICGVNIDTHDKCFFVKHQSQ